VSSAHNVSGQAYCLTVLTPVIDGREMRLAQLLDRLPSGAQSPLAGVPGTHFARWAVMSDVVYQGPEQGPREHLAHARLLFTSNFDGALDPYLEALRTGLGASADDIWGNCIGYPGSAQASGFARYLRHHQINSALFFAAYGDRTVSDVTRSLALRARLIDFAVRAQGMSPSDLQAGFLAEFGR
jgi:hypothetical protein